MLIKIDPVQTECDLHLDMMRMRSAVHLKFYFRPSYREDGGGSVKCVYNSARLMEVERADKD